MIAAVIFLELPLHLSLHNAFEFVRKKIFEFRNAFKIQQTLKV